ncbi:MAG: hypothetical protein WC526_00695 [Patescibacteria group bacterium]
MLLPLGSVLVARASQTNEFGKGNHRCQFVLVPNLLLAPLRSVEVLQLRFEPMQLCHELDAAVDAVPEKGDLIVREVGQVAIDHAAPALQSLLFIHLLGPALGEEPRRTLGEKPLLLR